jgi:hypothetical protein
MAGAWLLGAEIRPDRAEPPRTVLVVVTQADRTEEGAPGTATSLRELRPPGTCCSRRWTRWSAG